ncbi:MAG TPA: S8 family serine peptidase [Candidatus Polarisedimenticolia bacterium]|nr:S8 family serine peptidase [Candidatus Polarisedimenticolia bacterium]
MSPACPVHGSEGPGPPLPAAWWPPGVMAALRRRAPAAWDPDSGACAACVQEAIVETAAGGGHDAVLPSRARLGLDPGATGAGVTIAFVDSGFHPHPELVFPSNRIAAWADAALEPVRHGSFHAGELPRWPGWDRREGRQWHGLMCSAVAAGNGRLAGGLYPGPAPEARVALVQVLQPDGRVGNAAIARALGWLLDSAARLDLRVVSLAVGGDPTRARARDGVRCAVAELTARGVTVLAAAGNDGRRSLVPPASAPEAITVGGYVPGGPGLRNAVLWSNSHGRSAGVAKPDLVAPAAWVAAPTLPGAGKSLEAPALFERRHAPGEEGAAVERELAARKLLTPHHHHVDGTSVAVSLAAGVAACLLQARPGLSPGGLKRLLVETARPIPGPRARQGAGALDARAALERARSGG